MNHGFEEGVSGNPEEKTIKETLQSIDSTLKRMEIILLNIQDRKECCKGATEDCYRLYGIHPTF